MDTPKIFESEYRFCLILWEHEPIKSSELVSKDEVGAAEIDELVEKRFGGSLPAFIAAFTKERRLSRAQIDEIQDMIDRFREESENDD